MSVYLNVTEQNVIELAKLLDQQKNRKATKIENKILKQTHGKILAESSKPITEKLEKVNESTK